MLSPEESDQLLEDVRLLASEEMEGRATGTPGAERARRYVAGRFAAIGLDALEEGYRHPFELDGVAGVNLVGVSRGSEPDLGALLVLAHHDHLGVVDGELHPGADDNASGVAALLAVAGRLAASGTRRTLYFISPDAEERNRAGLAALVEAPPVPLENVELVINLDMLSRGTAGELWVAGCAHSPELAAPLRALASRAPLFLRLGHDRFDPRDPRHDWTTESDHAAFHEAGLPWLYFGVEDHDDYHTPRDSYERIDTDFLVRAAATVTDFLAEIADSR
jgi:Zn-dependent M28 family amino/carboxypeptidase